ncbi:MAG: AAA family ATPase [Chloroflexota bacterium]|nr:AAA family ATPase [Chloroflexota bacterium]
MSCAGRWVRARRRWRPWCRRSAGASRTVEEAPRLEPEAERLRLFDSVSEFLRSAARDQPLLLVLDDLHWADKPSLLLLQHIARSSGGDRLLILGAYRDVELDRTHPLANALAELHRLPNFRRVLLRGLPVETINDLLNAVDASEEGEGGRAALAQALHQETEGNPFFIREVLAHLIETGKIVREGGRWVSRVASVTELGIPEGVREVIGRRLSLLSEACGRVLSRASAMTAGFSWDELKAISGEGEGVLLDVLDEAIASQLISERKEQGAGRYDFTHALIRQTLYEELSTPRRVLLHRQIGEALELLYGSSIAPHLSELAHHFYRAAPGGDVEKAIDYARRAGDRATALFAWEEAVAHYERALQVIELRAAPDECLRIDLLLALAEARLSEGGNDDARKETALRATNIARQIGDRQRFARAVLSFAGPHREDGVLDPQLVALIEEALALMGPEDSGLRAMLLIRHSLAVWFAADRDLQRMRSHNEEAFAIARRLGDKQALAYVLARSVWAWDPSNTEEQIANAKEMFALAAEAGNKSVAMEAYMGLVGPLLEQGDRDGADVAIDAYIELQHEVRKPGWGTTWRAMQADLDGRLADVEPLATQGYAELQKVTENAGVVFGGQIIGLRRQQGRAMELEGVMRNLEALPMVRAALLGFTYAEGGRLDDARAAFEEAAADDFAGVPFDRNWPLTMSFLADTCTLLRDVGRASILYELILPYQDRCVVVTSSCIAFICSGSFHRQLGGLATTMSRWDDAERHFEAAIAMNLRMRSRGWAARTQSGYASMLLDRESPGDRERALALLQLALDAAQEMGMAKVVEDCEALKAQAQGVD